MRILIFGDSVAQGYFATRGGWVELIANDYRQQSLTQLGSNWTTVFNLGVDGDTARDGLKRLENETAARQYANEPTAIILAFGLNDATLVNNVAREDVYDFQENYEKLLKHSLKLADRVLCVGLTAVEEKLANPWKYSSSSEQWLNNRLNLFEDTIKQVAMNMDVNFVPVHDEFLRRLEHGEQLLADGLHPTDEGHKLIAALVHPELENLSK